MKLLSWNIMHGGGTRAARIIEALVAHDPDVIALTEYRTKPGMLLCTALAAKGWIYSESTGPAGIDNGICVISRTPMRRMRPCPAPPENLVRWLDIDFPEHGFGLGVLHILCAVPARKDGSPGEAKKRFWDAVLGAAEARVQEPFLFVGDWNTGLRRIDETGKTFVCADQFGKLPILGWTDMWRYHNRETEWTWYSRLKGRRAGEWV